MLRRRGWTPVLRTRRSASTICIRFSPAPWPAGRNIFACTRAGVFACLRRPGVRPGAERRHFPDRRFRAQPTRRSRKSTTRTRQSDIWRRLCREAGLSLCSISCSTASPPTAPWRAPRRTGSTATAGRRRRSARGAARSGSRCRRGLTTEREHELDRLVDRPGDPAGPGRRGRIPVARPRTCPGAVSSSR